MRTGLTDRSSDFERQNRTRSDGGKAVLKGTFVEEAAQTASLGEGQPMPLPKRGQAKVWRNPTLQKLGLLIASL